MDKNKLWIIGAALVMVAIVAGGWFLGIQPQLANAAAADAQRAQVVAENARQTATLAKLKTAYARLPELKSDLASLRESIPEGTDLPSFVDQVTDLCASTGASFTGYTTAASLPYVTASTGSSATSPTSTATSTPAPTSGATPSPAATPEAGTPPVTNRLVTEQNFVATPLTVTVEGGYANVLQFIKGLQTGKRLFLVTNVQTSATTDPSAAGTFDATVSGLIYSIVDSTPIPAPPTNAPTQADASASKG
ncbi:hypothetical protein [Leifsonia aquatica]|uniref:hypothetical protein n=1 Tax=Leifsonia aquatica TaxID=144185 RepID=UPI000469E857|nr:hypothetical protein [Leifsonia aquatica]